MTLKRYYLRKCPEMRITASPETKIKNPLKFTLVQLSKIK